jgi:A/G-specific adenine glycosylase
MDRKSKSLASFRTALLAWFRGNRREYPWRQNRDAYRVWLAEVMLQQTRIAAILPYYEKFLGRFPDLHALANSPESEVLRYWAGLGYYSRARNLHRAARSIAEQHDGIFPRGIDAALHLPGVGQYTAAAVLSIAHEEPHAVLDGNVARVLARLDAVRGDLRAPRRWQQLSTRAQELLAIQAPGDWNQALMELGETVCTPQSPRCEECPVRRWCEAKKRNLVGEIPAPRKKRATVRQRIAAAVLLDPEHRTFLVRDPGAHDDVLFSRLWQFPAVEAAKDGVNALERLLFERYGLRARAIEELPVSKHTVTFRSITLAPFLVRAKRLPVVPRSLHLPLAQIASVPLSSATRKIAEGALRAIDSDVTRNATPEKRSAARMLN